MLTPLQWQSFKDTVNEAADSFNQEVVTWHRLTKSLDRYGEDDKGSETYEDIPLNCLIAFNVFRTWPMSDETPAGLLDQESITMMLNRQYLINNSWVTAAGFFAVNAGKDEFTHMGVRYKLAGETPVSQAGDEPLHFYIILKRAESITGDPKY